MSHKEIREKFINFFKEKGHVEVPSSSLLPTDPSVLFTTAGMQQFKPYYTGEADPEKDFGSKNVVSIQKCLRTSDIDEVGDDSHLTFFEMLGNFSFGGYWKKEAIEYAYQFLTQELGLEIDYVTIFKGDSEITKDVESEKIWRELGVNDIRELGREDNFWGPTGDEGPCGPTTEIFVKKTKAEIWNLVFNQYYCLKDKSLKELETKGIDTGMGLERLTMAVQNKSNIFETDLFEEIIDSLPSWSSEYERRIITDHVRASVFLIADGVQPSNKERGYVLRRLLRRLMVHLTAAQAFNYTPFQKVIDIYGLIYKLDPKTIFSIIDKEEKSFSRTVRQGLRELDKLKTIDARSAFRLYESYGLPFELIKDIGKEKVTGLTREAFDEEFKKHQEISRAGAEKKFGGHGLILDTGELKAETKEEVEIVTRLHTATHLLHAALRKILGEEVKQAGSDITAERLRFDFTFPRKLTTEEIKQVEDLVNEVIQKDLPVTKEEMPYEEALKTGALSFFRQKYPEKVNVYSVGDFSKELCGGPHVSHTATIGQFKITKEEAVSAGTRRIRAIIV